MLIFRIVLQYLARNVSVVKYTRYMSMFVWDLQQTVLYFLTIGTPGDPFQN